MGKLRICLECGAVLENVESCQDYFHQMLFWEAENPSYGEVHHLSVLSYYLQHPNLFSQEGLDVAKGLLAEFLVEKITPKTARKRMVAKLESGINKPKIAGTEDSQGSYNYQIAWRITALDVVAGGVANYCDFVRKWAHSILETLAGMSIDDD